MNSIGIELENKLQEFKKNHFDEIYRYRRPSIFLIEQYCNLLLAYLLKKEQLEESPNHNLIEIRKKIKVFLSDLPGELGNAYDNNLVSYKEKWKNQFSLAEKLGERTIKFLKR